MAEFLLGSVFVVVVVAIVGCWWRRHPRRAWVLTTEVGWWFGGMLAGYAVVWRLTAEAPLWVGVAGVTANMTLWIGVLGPIMMRRFERRFPFVHE